MTTVVELGIGRDSHEHERREARSRARHFGRDWESRDREVEYLSQRGGDGKWLSRDCQGDYHAVV